MSGAERRKPGRPRLHPDQRLVQFSIRMPEPLRRKLTDYAEMLGVSDSTAIAWTLAERMNQITPEQWQQLAAVRQSRELLKSETTTRSTT